VLNKGYYYIEAIAIKDKKVLLSLSFILSVAIKHLFKLGKAYLVISLA
jgi:hypothetical protein